MMDFVEVGPKRKGGAGGSKEIEKEVAARRGRWNVENWISTGDFGVSS